MRTVPHSARRVTPVMMSVVMAVTCLTVFPADAKEEGKYPKELQAVLGRMDELIAKIDAVEKEYYVSYQPATREQHAAHYRAYSDVEKAYNRIFSEVRRSNNLELAKLEKRYESAKEAEAAEQRNPYLPPDNAQRYMQPPRPGEKLTESQLTELQLKIKAGADLEALMTPLSNNRAHLLEQRHLIKFHPLLGQPAPTLRLSTLEGKEVALRDYRDKKLVILSFWSIPTAESPDQPHWVSEINDLLQKEASSRPGGLAGLDVVEVGVSVDDARPKEVAGYVKKKGWTFPVLVDRGGQGSSAFDWGKKACQTTYIIDKSGRIRRRYAMVLNKQEGRYYAEHIPDDLLKHALEILAEMHAP